ncbi:MAG: hypothetical protein A3K65_08360 [Euryarchaeota archaeon RBG_16_68_12]|nr:MAG: hypothetical protein A3K65_08360 [Euryarchaeota archaeon RBG_16_68_12]
MATVLGLDPTLSLVIGAVLIVLGLVMAFFGRGVWAFLMGIIGAAIGSILGFIIGFAVGNYLLGLILAIVGGIVGGYLFGKLVKIALALVMGVLAAALVFGLMGSPTGTGLGDTRTIIAIVAFFVVFALSYYFVEELIAIITSIIGGLLVALGVYILLGTGTSLIAGAAGLGVFVIGAVVQTIKLRRQKRIAKAMAAPQAAYAYPPPQQQAPPPPPT